MISPAAPAPHTHSLGAWFFRYRDLLPIPLVLGMCGTARPRLRTWLLGLPLVIAGELLRLWGLRYIGPTTRTRAICADCLVTGGPYRYVRHPLYLANTLKILGLLIIAGHLPFAAVTACFYVVEFLTMIPYEEHFLAQRFPELFDAYRSSIPAFLPDGRIYQSDFAPRHTWTEALRSERRTFASTGGLLGILGLCTIWRGSSADGCR